MLWFALLAFCKGNHWSRFDDHAKIHALLCFSVLVANFPSPFRVTWWHWGNHMNCPGASEATLTNLSKKFTQYIPRLFHNYMTVCRLWDTNTKNMSQCSVSCFSKEAIWLWRIMNVATECPQNASRLLDIVMLSDYIRRLYITSKTKDETHSETVRFYCVSDFVSSSAGKLLPTLIERAVEWRIRYARRNFRRENRLLRSLSLVVIRLSVGYGTLAPAKSIVWLAD